MKLIGGILSGFILITIFSGIIYILYTVFSFFLSLISIAILVIGSIFLIGVVVGYNKTK